MAKQNFYIRVRRRNPKLKVMQDYKKKISGTIEKIGMLQICFCHDKKEWSAYGLETGILIGRKRTKTELETFIEENYGRIIKALLDGFNLQIDPAFLPGALDRLEEWNND